jgi:hypothetical protein
MPEKKQKIRVAMPAWEIGRVGSGLGTKIGGLGVIAEELPAELVKAAAKKQIDLEVVTLTPCFAHYDKSQLTKLDLRLPVTMGSYTFEFEVYRHIFPDGQEVIYFWDEWQLNWTHASAIYPSDPQMGLSTYASLSQAMAGYIKQGDFDTVHLHDYHVGLIPFYLGDEYLQDVPVHFTIHNATYQGIIPLVNGGFGSLFRINLPGDKLFHKYFDFFDNLNLMKACTLKVHETGGKITTSVEILPGPGAMPPSSRRVTPRFGPGRMPKKGRRPARSLSPTAILIFLRSCRLPASPMGSAIATAPRIFRNSALKRYAKCRTNEDRPTPCSPTLSLRRKCWLSITTLTSVACRSRFS